MRPNELRIRNIMHDPRIFRGSTTAPIRSKTIPTLLDGEGTGEEEKAAQTDEDIFDGAPTPIFIPTPSGVDAETQVNESELWDWEAEEKDIIQRLVGKTLEDALEEVLEEEERAVATFHSLHMSSLHPPLSSLTSKEVPENLPVLSNKKLYFNNTNRIPCCKL
ncbi:unnamed protein product [Darwinula stevensoni]|uniref:Uncharacterized protein n=1 Tax=Darwinula stevensoni TaxID=69355 RepID=A0A7R8X4Z5_9CRUS|nr:unnamed protein product [Darwinula stevensoni]CAG0886117.1 unnamed protein product [Darwinula stevensoni]